MRTHYCTVSVNGDMCKLSTPEGYDSTHIQRPDRRRIYRSLPSDLTKRATNLNNKENNKMNALTAQQKLERAAVWIMKQPEFIAYSGVMMVGDSRLEPDPAKCPTAYTDGYNVVYGEQFVEKLTEPELRFVMLHETIHKMYQHTSVWQHLFKQSPILANAAADYVVNGTIMEANCSGVSMPKDCLYDKKLSHNHDVGQVFRELMKKYPKLAHPQAVCAGDGSDLKGFDVHDWGKAHGWSKEERQAIQEQIDSAIRQGAILAGKVAGGQTRGVGDLMTVPIDPWAILRQFLTDTCQGDGELSYSRPNRRFLQHDLIMPTEICHTLPHLMFALDTSGSIHGEALTYLLSNVVHIFKTVRPDKVDLLYWDTEVAGVETYDRDELDKMISVTTPKGGGGTSPQCITNYLKKERVEPTALIVLTDGYVDRWPTDPGVPVIWLMYENKSANPPYGVVAHI